jgi:hypothetical protein
MPKLREQLAAKNYPVTDEMAVLYAMFPQQVDALLKPKAPAPAPVPVVSAPAPAPAPVPAPAPAPVPVAAHTNGKSRQFAITVNGVRRNVTVQEA